MVVYYQIAGQKVGSHMLSIGVLSTLFGGIWAMSGGSKKSAGPNNTPPLNASSKDEENFIQYVFLFSFLSSLSFREEVGFGLVGNGRRRRQESMGKR
ncbi:hypothetical protein D0861_01389 [Hortaea werneckii]|uniref:Uncharacterized protein n=1 Tax=Hortaea werneckii TaxID=91943 RepID=A0A3M7G120_HORWE|nr:hypothetical protein D0861_01389 [Hortaea werneckii]